MHTAPAVCRRYRVRWDSARLMWGVWDARRAAFLTGLGSYAIVPILRTARLFNQAHR
ncbi:hypothetical protein [Streptomyces sp. NPDC059893]|uniref:hypothetical protein n=1 Tax=Streptomyces sp. NPDC059893 TaxID=3346990 RepID=UPI00364EF7B7